MTCCFTGRLDTNVSLALWDQLNDRISALKGGNDPELLTDDKIVFDMQGVDYIASSFIRIRINAAKQVQKGNFSIIHCDPFLKKTFQIAGLGDLFRVS